MPSKARGALEAPPSKSAGHRMLICAGLSKEESIIHGIAPSKDMLATIDEKVKITNVVDNENTTIIEPNAELSKFDAYWNYIKMSFIEVDMSTLKKTNSNSIGWLQVKGTDINYPVVQGEDNEYYLEFLINGDWNAKGTPFVDAHCPSPFNDYLTIIYGHRMKDGSMFASLLKYFDDSTYFSQFPTIELYTPGGNYDLEIVSGAKIDASDATYYRFGDFSAEERVEYGNTITAANRILGFDKEITLDGSERLVMLSTCTPQSDNFRFVIWGRLVPMQ